MKSSRQCGCCKELLSTPWLLIPYVLKFSRDETFAFFVVWNTIYEWFNLQIFRVSVVKSYKMDTKQNLAPSSPLYWIGSTNTDHTSIYIS